MWVKGGDYTISDLPEAPVLRRHGAQIKIIPLVSGYSTSRIVAAIPTARRPENRRRRKGNV
ncbi:MAG: hypothetical protein DLM62_00305 [Pseudonocardiales bacterium]|nr:MAG: hypothetical protein DLM62_00305 [Pseudonocardiales bacterium]